MANDDLAMFMARVDRAITPSDAPLSLRAEVDLRRIRAGGGVNASSGSTVPRRRGLIVGPSLAAILVVIIVAIQALIAPGASMSPATAVTPPLLVGSGTPKSFTDAVDDAVRTLLDGPSDEATRGSHAEGWFLNTEVMGGATSSVISPQDIDLRWDPDLSGTLQVRVGRPYEVDGAYIPPNAAGNIGKLLQDDKFAEGEMGILFQQRPPESSEAMRDYLASVRALADPNDPVALLDAIALMRNEWTLSARQEAAVLAMLAASTGITSLGNVNDRLSRPGLAFTASSPTDARYNDVLVISPVTGRILSIEKVYLGGIPEYKDVPAPAVTSYYAWK